MRQDYVSSEQMQKKGIFIGMIVLIGHEGCYKYTCWFNVLLLSTIAIHIKGHFTR